jgi:hypothetical protein
MQERGEEGAGTRCKNGREEIIVMKGKFNITCWDSLRIYSKLYRRLACFSISSRS